MKLTPGGSTDKGRVRSGNEDNYVVDRRLQLYAVADGMGGHRGGEVASATALEALRAAVASGTGLGDAITSANSAVHAKAADDEELAGMGTTLTAVVPDGSNALFGHVGDSRAYLLHDGELRQVTDDHSLVEEMVREGKLTEEEAAVHPRRSIITRALGVDDSVEVDVFSVPLADGDRILICSDGLTTMVRPDDIAGLLRRESDPTRAANLLVDAANAAGGEDNITAVVIDVEDDGLDPLAMADPGPDLDATAAIETVPPFPDDPAAAAATAAAAPAVTPDAPAEETQAVETVAPEETPPKRPRHQRVTGEPLPDEASAARALADKARAEQRQQQKQARHPVRSAGRFARFAVPIILILGLAVAMTAWFARRTYFVEFNRAGEVTVYQGRPGGLLIWDPTVIQRSTVTRDDLPEDAVLDVEDVKEFSNRADAIAFAARVEARSTATTTTTTTTTTLPGAVQPVVPPS
jgi:protein phosphatase